MVPFSPLMWHHDVTLHKASRATDPMGTSRPTYSEGVAIRASVQRRIL